MASTIKEAIEQATAAMEKSNAIMASLPVNKAEVLDPEKKDDEQKAEDPAPEVTEDEKKEPTIDEKIAKLEERIKALEDDKQKTDEESASLKIALEKATVQMGKMCAAMADPANVMFARGVQAKTPVEAGTPAPKAKSVFEQWAAISDPVAAEKFYVEHSAEIVECVNA